MNRKNVCKGNGVQKKKKKKSKKIPILNKNTYVQIPKHVEN